MGGGSGKSFSGSRSPRAVEKMVQSLKSETSAALFETTVGGLLTDLLGTYNSRDSYTAGERLKLIKGALQEELDGSFDQFFGGSVAKHTYVDGLSDIDSILVINDTKLEKKAPRDVLDRLTSILTEALDDPIEVDHGRMAVTVRYRDGMIVQLLPAIESEDGHLHVPSSRREDWSKIDPERFQNALTRRNQACAGKLVPVIKLAKAVVGQLPESQRPSGYHVESLAIAAFKNYDGPLTPAAMLPTFFERAKDLVLSPIRDKSGQSVHVDGYLGPEASPPRLIMSHVFERTAKRMRNATAAASEQQWRSFFGEDE